MVLTRRAARAAAEAVAADACADKLKTLSDPHEPNGEQLLDGSASSEAPASKSEAESEVDNDEKEDLIKPIPEEKAPPHGSGQYELTRRSIGWRLWIGHVSALTAVFTVAHAATMPVESALPYHALLLLLSALPLRATLAFYAHSLQTPVVRSGMVLALSASVVFSSNALNVLATRTSPRHILPLVAFAAVDVCAAWLNMTVSAKTPSTEPFAILIAFIYSAADIFLAADVSKQQSFVDLFFPFLVLRFLLNLRLLVQSAICIVRRDEARKSQQVQR